MHVHYLHKTENETGALCGAKNNRATTHDPKAVSCPLCVAILDGRALAHGAVDLVERRVTTKLAELQRDPAVRAVAWLVHSVVRAESGRKGEKG